MSAHSWHAARAAESQAAILAIVRQQPSTRKRISEVAGMHKASITHHMRTLREEKKVYISRWEKQSRNGGQYMAVFALGSKQDAPKPTPMTKAEAARAFRRRLWKDPAKHMDYIMKAKIRDTRRQPPPPPDPMLGWIPRRAA